jgi:glycosyltransferase involved in cell wall biosynthesis
MTPPAVAWRSRVVRRDLPGVDRAVLMGTTFEIPRTVPFVTYDDMTVGQFAALNRLPRRVVAPWAARQARALRDAVGCCVTGPWVTAALEAEYGVARERIAEVGIGANVVSPPVEGRDWSVARFLFIGVDWERKGGDRVLAAFRELRTAVPEAALELVGRTPGVSEPGVTDHGWIDMRTPDGLERLLAAFRRATCFVMPSRFEPFAIVHAEAGLAGVPSIGTTVGGVDAVIGPAGVTVPPGDHAALVRAMRELADPETARRYGEKAREHALRFTWENVVRRIAERLDGDHGRATNVHSRPARTTASKPATS